MLLFCASEDMFTRQPLKQYLCFAFIDSDIDHVLHPFASWRKVAHLVGVCVQDSLPEWSKGVDSSSTSESCVGSNPTAVML